MLGCEAINFYHHVNSQRLFFYSGVNRVLTHIVKHRDSAVSCAKNGWTDRDAIWDAESGGFREHVKTSTQEPKSPKFPELGISIWSLMQNKHCGARRTHESILVSSYTRLYFATLCRKYNTRWHFWFLTVSWRTAKIINMHQKRYLIAFLVHCKWPLKCEKSSTCITSFYNIIILALISAIFGRPFVNAMSYAIGRSSACLSLQCGQTVGRIKMKLGMQVGLGPGHIVLDGDPVPLPQRAQLHPIFGPYLLQPNGCMDQDATWYWARPQPRRLYVRWGPSPQFFGPCLL